MVSRGRDGVGSVVAHRWMVVIAKEGSERREVGRAKENRLLCVSVGYLLN